MTQVNPTINTMYMYKASSAASWSYIGLLFPLIGIILAIVSMARLRHFIPTDEAEAMEKRRIGNRAAGGLFVSILFSVIGFFLLIVILGTIARMSSMGY